MSRRLVRTAMQAGILGIFTLIVIYLLDNRYSVLPLAMHHYLPFHHHVGHVITDITILTCSNPLSNCRLDPRIWMRLEKDIYLGKNYVTKSYLHYQVKPQSELKSGDKFVVDVKVSSQNPSKSAAAGDVKWDKRPVGLWLKFGTYKTDDIDTVSITGVDILFGPEAIDPRPVWEMQPTPLLLSLASGIETAFLTVRRGDPPTLERPVLRVNGDGKFKILQAADLHLSTGPGNCRDAVPSTWKGGKCEADPRTLEFFTRLLDTERPDLVVLSGDQINDGTTTPDAQTAIFKFAAPLIERKIPYATIFGNHDDDHASLPRAAQMALLQSLPYCVSQAGPTTVSGVGNYILEILGRKPSQHSAITVYLLDSHSYSPDEKKFHGYDWIREDQINWFQEQSKERSKDHGAYTYSHLDMAFIHIPLPEYRDIKNPRVGEWREPPTAPVFNSGFRDALVHEKVLLVSAGHDHANDYCALSSQDGVPALWMCYAGGSGLGGYGGYGGYIRRMRVFELNPPIGMIRTWKRTEAGEDVDRRINEQIVVENGRLVPMEMPQAEES